MSEAIRPRDVSMVVPDRRPGELTYHIRLAHRPTGAHAEGEGPTIDAAMDAAKEALAAEVEVFMVAEEARRQAAAAGRR